MCGYANVQIILEPCSETDKYELRDYPILEILKIRSILVQKTKKALSYIQDGSNIFAVINYLITSLRLSLGTICSLNE